MDTIKRLWTPAVVCAVLAAIIRLFALNAFQHSVLFEPIEGSAHDRSLYIQAITQVANGQFWPDGAFEHLPLYPWLMGLVSMVCGFSLKLAGVIGIIIDAFTTFIIVRLAQRIGASVGLAVIAGLIYAAYPLAIIYSLMTMPNSLNAFGVTAFVYIAQCCYSNSTNRTRYVYACILGLFAGTVTLGFAGMIPIALMACVVLSFKLRSVIFPLLFLAGMVLPITPVAMHNTQAEGRFVLLTTHGGLNFYMGNHELATGYPLRIQNFRMTAQAMLEDAHRYAEQSAGKTMSKSESSDWWRAQANTFWRENPTHATLLTIKKIMLFWNCRDVDDLRMLEQLRITDSSFRNLHGTPFALFGMLGLIGLMFTRKSPVVRISLFTGMVGLVLFFITARYRLTFVPMMASLGVAGLEPLWLEWKNKNFYRTVWLLPMALVVLFPFNMRDQRPVDHYNAAIQLMNRGRDIEAANVVDRGLAVDPNSADLYFARGNLLFKQEKFTEAATAFSQSLSRNPGNPTAVFNLALSLARNRDYCGARDALLRMQKYKMPIDEKTQALFNELNAACDAAPE